MPSVPSGEGALKLNPIIPIDQSIYEESTTQKAPLGTKLELGDKVFRYAKAGSGQLGVKAGRIACVVSAPGTHGGTFVSFAVATTGAQVIYATIGATVGVANTYAEGSVIFSGGTRAGEQYKIKAQGLGDASTGKTNVALTLYDPIIGTLTATSLAALQLNRYNVAVRTAATAGDIVGVSMIDVTEGNYFWLQTKGVAPVIAASAVGASIACILGTTGTINSAALSLTSGAADIIVGRTGLEAAVTDKATPVILMLE
jgi:hypothetical protein